MDNKSNSVIQLYTIDEKEHSLNSGKNITFPFSVEADGNFKVASTSMDYLVELAGKDDETEKQRIYNELRSSIRGSTVWLDASWKKAQQIASEKKKQRLNSESLSTHNFILTYDRKGNVENTIDNYVQILENDSNLERLGYNDFTGIECKLSNTVWLPLKDSDDSYLRMYIEKEYHIHDRKKLSDAVHIVCNNNRFNPLKEMIEHIEWDGIPRIDRCFIDLLKCEDTKYNRACSKMIFSGGIKRLYEPGCKYDYTIVLIGTSQGEGKSTFVRYLAMKDEYFGDISTFEGKTAVEGLYGKWMIEIGELLALKRSKDVEGVKAFLTRTFDSNHRKAYGTRAENLPRKCAFIGTTNNLSFLSDRTGNRRFLPVTVHSDGSDFYIKEKEYREYIRQCWAERYHKYKMNELELIMPAELKGEILMAQGEATEDDFRFELIRNYLENRDRTCIKDICYNVFQKPVSEYDKRLSREIGAILDSLPDWERTKSTARFTIGGIQTTQRTWVRKKTAAGSHNM